MSEMKIGEVVRVERRLCPAHGEYDAQIFKSVFFGIQVEQRCPACEIKMEEEYKKREAINYLKLWNIPTRYHEESFDTYRVDESRMLNRAVEICKRFSGSEQKGRNLLIAGPSGIGKTHLACSIIKSASMKSKHYIDIVSLLELLKSKYSERTKDLDESEKLGKYLWIDLLVIDNIEQFNPTKDNMKWLFAIINGRVNEMKSTVLISSDTIDETKNKLSLPLYNKINNFGYILKMFKDGYSEQP